MKAYRVYYDKSDNTWKYENFLSDVGHTTDFELWIATISQAESACIHFNKNFIADAKDMFSSNHYTFCTCKDCKSDFILTCNEYFWFLDRDLSVPKRCPKCRKKKQIKS